MSAEEKALRSRHSLRHYTPARVLLERAGPAVGTRDQLAFQLDHALARDAVHARLEAGGLIARLRSSGFSAVALESAVRTAGSESGRAEYLRRPDLGRRLNPASAELLDGLRLMWEELDVVFALVDGLSALAVERHGPPLLDALSVCLTGVRLGPVCVVRDGRVAIGDEIGAALGARVSVVLIGERPGLSSPDSLGVYITANPRPGRTNAERNCISNIRHEGLSYAEAAGRVLFLLAGARRLGATGVQLRWSPEATRAGALCDTQAAVEAGDGRDP